MSCRTVGRRSASREELAPCRHGVACSILSLAFRCRSRILHILSLFSPGVMSATWSAPQPVGLIRGSPCHRPSTIPHKRYMSVPITEHPCFLCVSHVPCASRRGRGLDFLEHEVNHSAYRLFDCAGQRHTLLESGALNTIDENVRREPIHNAGKLHCFSDAERMR
jgi:hypothetical protein